MTDILSIQLNKRTTKNISAWRVIIIKECKVFTKIPQSFRVFKSNGDCGGFQFHYLPFCRKCILFRVEANTISRRKKVSILIRFTEREKKTFSSLCGWEDDDKMSILFAFGVSFTDFLNFSHVWTFTVNRFWIFFYRVKLLNLITLCSLESRRESIQS